MSAASEMSRAGLRVVLPPHLARGPSPTPEARHRLQVSSLVPSGGGGCGSSTGVGEASLWGEEESDLIRSCAALSSALGVHKSFSTTDITQVGNHEQNDLNRQWVSEVNISFGYGRLDGVFLPRLDPTSRSCSTWVAVGDVVSTSQLPSPQARLGSLESPAITAADFIRSVNKKVRQNYIKRRLVTTYRALQRFSASELNLDVSGVAAAQVVGNAAGVGGAGPMFSSAATPPGLKVQGAGVTLMVPTGQSAAAQDVFRIIKKEVEMPIPAPPSHKTGKNDQSLTTREVDRDRGRPLTKYERNMMIFNWLQTLEETTYDMVS